MRKVACLTLLGLATFFSVVVFHTGCGDAPPLGGSRFSLVATSTPGPLSGEVVIVGGINSGGSAVGAAELYDPASGLFSGAGPLNQARAFHTATLINNIIILVTGGQTGSGAVLASAELYDSTKQAFSLTTGKMQAARTLHTATLLGSGQVLITGGTDANGIPLASAELYNPATQTFSAVGDMNFARAGHTATLLANGSVLIVGGFANAPATTIVQQAEIYNPNTQQFTLTGNLSTARYFHTAAFLPTGIPAGQVLIAGGHDGAGVSATAELYNVATGAFSAAGIMTISRAEFAAAMLQNGLVLLCGGLTNLATISSTAGLYNSAATFGPAGSMSDRRHFHTATTLTGGPLGADVLVAGGENGASFNSAVASADLYEPALNNFVPTGSMANSRFAHTATLLP